MISSTCEKPQGVACIGLAWLTAPNLLGVPLLALVVVVVGCRADQGSPPHMKPGEHFSFRQPKLLRHLLFCRHAASALPDTLCLLMGLGGARRQQRDRASCGGVSRSR
jgi:hypothetical protein